MKENGKLYPKYEIWKQYLLIMMQEHFYPLYVFPVQRKWWSGNPLLVDFEDLPYITPGRGPIYTPFLHQNDIKGCPGS